MKSIAFRGLQIAKLSGISYSQRHERCPGRGFILLNEARQEDVKYRRQTVFSEHNETRNAVLSEE